MSPHRIRAPRTDLRKGGRAAASMKERLLDDGAWLPLVIRLGRVVSNAKAVGQPVKNRIPVPPLGVSKSLDGRQPIASCAAPPPPRLREEMGRRSLCSGDEPGDDAGHHDHSEEDDEPRPKRLIHVLDLRRGQGAIHVDRGVPAERGGVPAGRTPLPDCPAPRWGSHTSASTPLVPRTGGGC
jgi:hypothetical protein